jgi:hypothetical protein
MVAGRVGFEPSTASVSLQVADPTLRSIPSLPSLPSTIAPYCYCMLAHTGLRGIHGSLYRVTWT